MKRFLIEEMVEKYPFLLYTKIIMNKFYITTAIPYVNNSPHIGFALELVQTDVIARSHRVSGDDTFFLTGADENALKNVQAAQAAHVPTKKFVDENTKKFIALNKELNISNDDFIKTSSRKHFSGAQKFWSACKKEDIYKKKYKGLYCVGCETFYTEKDLVKGKCPEHKIKLEAVEEENYFFKLTNYQKKLEKLIESNTYAIVPESRKNEVLSFIKMGLKDFSISRSVKRAKGWGVPVPGDDSQIMYVWFDALSNYITALDYEKNGKLFKKFWPANTHVVGKGIIRFHAVYWPAMLLSAGLSLPKKLFVHGYINIEGEKISKSTGNIVDPFELIEKYGSEVVRYFLLRYIHPVQDSEFSIEKLERAYTADLANGLGNLVSRVAGLIEQNGIEIKLLAIENAKKREGMVGGFIDTFHFDIALKYIWSIISELDKFIDKKEPWVLAKDEKKKELEEILSKSAAGIISVAELLEPFLPETSEKIIKIFFQKKIKKGKPLFPRL